MNRQFYKIFFLLICFANSLVFAQQKAKVFGIVKDEKGNIIENATVVIQGTTSGLKTNASGIYLFELDAEKPIVLTFSYIGFESQSINIQLKSNEAKHLDITLKTYSHIIRQVNIRDQQARVEGMQTVDPKVFELMTNASGNIEGVLKTLNGVSSNNELSSEYNVRGGNYDENLVYVNDFEIHRPMLIQSSQQEGLSFVNPDMVSNLKFSAGGFQAKYGDKLSSVLDITYKQPKQFGGSVSVGLLGQSIELEGCSRNKKFTWLTGFRNKTNQSLLSSQQTPCQRFANGSPPWH